MAHIEASLPKNTYIIDAGASRRDGQPVRGSFFAITCSIPGSVKLKGAGIYKFVDVDVSVVDYLSYIDPSTGERFVDDAAMTAAGDGFYELLDTIEDTVPMIAGQTIYGKFTEVGSDGTFTGFAYVG